MNDTLILIADITVENRIRNDLTGAERKAFAAEVGRICTVLFEKSLTDGQSQRDFNWFRDWWEKSGLGKNTAHTWWSSFCKSAGLSITPKQATDDRPPNRRQTGQPCI